MKQSGRNKTAALVMALTGFAFCGCGGESGTVGSDSEGSGSTVAPLSAEVQGWVDEGNVAQREGRYGDALEVFRKAMDGQPGHAVPQFGALMAAMALGETALVDSLRAELEVTGPELLSMLNPGGAMGGEVVNPHSGPPGLPPGHPDLPDAVAQPPDTLG